MPEDVSVPSAPSTVATEHQSLTKVSRMSRRFARASRAMAKFIMLSVLLSMAAANPIIVPHFHGQIFFPLFRHQHQYQQVDRSDQESQHGNFASDYSGAYNSFDTPDNGNNAIAQEDESQSSQDFGAQHQQQQQQYQQQYQQPDYSAFTDFNGQAHETDDNPEGRHDVGFEQGDQQHHYVQSVPVSEHVEVTRPVAVPVYKEIGVPVPHPIKINVPHPVAVGVPQPYPVAVPVSHPVPIQIIKTIAVPVEKKVPYPVEKHIPVPVEKPVPIRIEKHIPVPVYKPYPIKVPVYKTIYHHAKGHGGHSHGYGYGHGHGHHGH